MAKITRSLDNKIRYRIRGNGRGWCFTPNSFLDLADKNAVWVGLSRLTQKQTIRRLARGLYDYPIRHPKIGLLAPDPEAVAKALSERDAARLQPSGAYAANLLGLSEQVPARIVFLTDGRARRVRLGRQEIVLKRTSTRNMATAGRISGTVIQALRHLGSRQITDQQIEHLRISLPPKAKAQLKRDRVYAPVWMHRIIGALAEEPRA